MLQLEIEKLPSFRMGKEKGIEKGIIKGFEMGLKKGIKRGVKKEKSKSQRRLLEIARELFIMNVSIEKIMDMTRLSRVELEQLKKEV